MPNYVVIRQPPAYRQYTFEDFLKGVQVFDAPIANAGRVTATRTYRTENVNEKLRRLVDTERLTCILEAWNRKTAPLRELPRSDLYRHFYIPKHSGGLRPIDAPVDELMNALRELKGIFEKEFGALYHTAAFAYVKGRCAVDAVKRHQANESRWFAKFDFHNFFGSTTEDFVCRMFSMVFPFSLLMETPRGAEALKTALSLCFLNGGLPQGTPISPFLTNVMMIPIDHALSNRLRDFGGQHLVYTRYADDMLISCRFNFQIRDVEMLIFDTLRQFEAPFRLNKSKTRYGSSSGSNWNLGVMLNKDNEITVGNTRKRQFQSMLTAYIRDKRVGISWDIGDIQTMEGLRSYYRSVEGETIDRIVAHINTRFGVNVVAMIKADLHPA